MNTITTIHNKKTYEQTLLKTITKYIKDVYGRGPNDIQVKIHQQQVHVFIKGFILKQFEILVDESGNPSCLDDVYHQMYLLLKDDGIKHVSESIGRKIEIVDLKMDLAKDTCTAILNII